MQSLPPFDAGLDRRLKLIVASYHRLTGKQLLAAMPQDIAALRQALWEAPRAIVAHGTEHDPVFFYGNRLALQLFEMDFTSFTVLPSQRSAEPQERGERARLLARVKQHGYVDDYSGVRIASSGKRFMINAATVWNLQDGDGILLGQAATFTDWRPL
ncbi:MAG: MEKHLA domain-containing protein [Nitrosomonadales bacterium]|nr:MEKHLA domain-containing protein [Nitrosomonadales bacterium]